MLVSEDAVMKVVATLTATNREFHTTELAQELSSELGMQIESDVARYWANQLCLKNVLERRQISARLYVYHRKEGADLPSSVTIRHRKKKEKKAK